MIIRALPSGLPDCHERLCRTAAAAAGRSRQGCRDPCPATPDHHFGTATRRRHQGEIRPGGPGVPRGSPDVAAARSPARAPAPHPPGHRPSLAPAIWPASAMLACVGRSGPDGRYRALHRRSRSTAGQRESVMGLPARARRAHHPRYQGRALHRLGDPQAGTRGCAGLSGAKGARRFAARPLAGFAVAEVGPGTSTTVSIDIPRRAAEIWTDNGWHLVRGDYVLQIGHALDDIRLTTAVTL
ncbi:fibronectin type III-like domain-contianing protein [Nonomuraea sp. NBC_00507]|uniref:fibronectin type III-like domain-contianing protein n=1 Tax=Nonomuraea sp. NBC_00507 TaxID=2976002 RepID=UPI003FA5B3EB